jgi:hypothetical protein
MLLGLRRLVGIRRTTAARPEGYDGRGKKVKSRALVAVCVLALAGVAAPAAQAHQGKASITCTSVTYSFTGFPSGSQHVIETVLIDGSQAVQKEITFPGPSGGNTLAISVPAGSHEVTAEAFSVNVGAEVEGFPVTQTLTCPSSPPPPTCPTASIKSNFNGTAIPGGDWIWFNSVLKASGASSGGTITFTGQTITFGSTTVPVRDATITFSPSATTATTVFNVPELRWETTVPAKFGDNVFLSGLGFHVPAGGLPGGINPVTWSGNFSTSPGISLNWQWGAAVYGEAFTNGGVLEYEYLKVKPVHSTSLDAYHNGDQAGTPENPLVKHAVTGGARGGGGSNFTGSYSATGHCP